MLVGLVYYNVLASSRVAGPTQIGASEVQSMTQRLPLQECCTLANWAM